MKYGVFDWGKLLKCLLLYTTKENHHLKTYIKFDIKSEIAALKEEHKTYII